jgi:hypothetical protein
VNEREQMAGRGVPARDVDETQLRDLGGNAAEVGAEENATHVESTAEPRPIATDDPLNVQASPSGAAAPDPVTGEQSGSGGWGLGTNNATAGVVPGRDATPLTRTGDPEIIAGRTSANTMGAGGGGAAGSPRNLVVTDGALDPPALEGGGRDGL